MKKSSVLAVALVIALASTIMAAEPDANSAQILAHEKSEPRHVLKPEAAAETAAQAGCCACPADATVTGDIYVGPISRYLFRGNNILGSNNAFAIQGGVDLTYKELTFSYWTNAQNRNTANYSGYSRAKVTENDLILDYAIPYTLPFLDKLKFNIGTQYFALAVGDDTNEFYLKASYDTLLKPTFTVYWDNMLASRAGLFYTASVSHKITIERNLFALNLGALVSYNQRNPNAAWTPEGDGVYSDWHNYELTASFDYTPTANITITPSYMFSNGISAKAKNFGIGEQNAFGLKAMFAF